MIKTKLRNSRRRARQKKGVVLLIIVTLLTLFIMIGITLALLASNYKHASEELRFAGAYGDLPEKELELSLEQLLVGTARDFALPGLPANPTSISPHNFLADYYGVDGVAGTVTAYVEENQNQVIRITYQQAASQPFNQNFSPIPHYYAGRVITFTDGIAAGYSTRVLAYLPTVGNAATGTLFVEAIESDLPIRIVPSNGSRFLINGAPFNGTGFGYFPGTYNIDMDENGGNSGGAQIGLLGNFAALPDPSIAYAGGGPDEPWDAPDLQNMYLAVIAPVNGDGNPANDVPTIPSFHRPELINYWLYQINPGGGNINQIPLARLRQISLRPIGAEYGNNADHPNFTGSNPNYHPINGPWDVDNNGDGLPDSIWIDPNLPIMTAKDGRKYKRLFAYLVMDLDGRINVNVHGNLNQLAAQNRADQGTAALGLFPGGNNLSRGIGYGPGEIDFMSVFGNFTTPNDFMAYRTMLTQRYGLDGLPGTANTRDGFNVVKHHGTPNDYANFAPPMPVFEWASPPDVWGRGALALDTSGNPITLYMGQTGEMLDNPYEIHVGQHPLGADSPYTVAEMEALLRYHDSGANGLDTRLFNSGSGQRYLNVNSRGVLGPDHRLREILTTLSHSSPVPMARVPREFFADSTQQTKPGYFNAVTFIQAKHNPSLLDLYTYKLIRDGAVMDQNDPLLPTHINALIPWEIRHGQLLDINRFLGNGLDDNGDYVADDYNEALSGVEPAWVNNPQVPPTFQGATAWHTNDIDFNPPGFNGQDFVYARQLLARHLFALMLALVDDGYVPPPPTPQETPPLSQQDLRELLVRRIAQWAINVVDFRDSDAVMTPFEYDVNPFNANGWSVDGNLGTDGNANPEQIIVNGAPVAVNTAERRVVWGAEFPDLQLTETFGMHDRRTRDTNYEMTTTRFIDGGDPHPDQLRLPQGSLFVELYCPRASYNNNPRLPQELYADYGSGQWRLNLQKLVPASTDGVQRPVWRLAISDHTGPNAPASVTDETPWARILPPQNKGLSTSFEPNNMSLLPAAVPPQLPIDRYVWFSSVDPPPLVVTAPEWGRTYVNSLGWDVSLEPGQYAVVGPRTATYVGSRNDDPALNLDGDSPQGILLSQRTMLNPNGVVANPLVGAPIYTPGTQIKNAVGIVCDMPVPVAPDPNAWLNATRRIGLNVTEPMPLIQGYYYREPTSPNGDDAYDDFVLGPLNTLPDEPFEWPAAPVQYPIAGWNMYSTGTYDNVRAIFLQRLANPNAAWDPTYNPYITIDWASTDVTVFTGEDTPQVPTAMMNDRDSSDTWDPLMTQLQFHSRQKGIAIPANSSGPVPNVTVNLWTNNWANPPDTAASAAAITYFDYDMVLDSMSGQSRSTFAYLNRNLGTPQFGDPAEGPFPWLAHLDRPFTSPMELLMVPAWPSGRLTQEFQALTQPGTPRPGVNPYDLTQMNFGPTFTQLLNFFQTGNPVGPAKISPQFTRFLDYVEVPSRYSATEKWFNPSNANQNFGDPAAANTVAATYRPPFNKRSRFADPGRININTIFDDAVLEAVLGQYPNPGNAGANQAFRRWVVFSRQGYGDPTNLTQQPLGMDINYPTRFANPFRTADSADMMPAFAAPSTAVMRKAPVEATLLRSTAIGTATPTSTPLFDVPNNPIYNYNDPYRNAYFKHQIYQRLGNLFTTQSNVYAVWITVGYFEVEQNPGGVDAAHPDGYRLGQEIGADSGSAIRHRMFSIVDRTIPAAYEPGKRHNTDRMILLRRYIE